MADATDTTDVLPDEEVALLDAWWRAANYLSVGQIYLLDNPLLRAPARARGHQAAAARPLGHDPGAQPALDPPQPADPRARRQRDLPGRARARRPGGGRQRLARGHLQRGLPAHRRRRGRDAAAVPAVLLPRRHPEPRRAGDARLDPRGRRARLRPLPRLRRRDGQPGPASSPRWSATASSRPARWPRRGTPTSSSTRSTTARCCRSCTSTATRSPTRPSRPGSRARSSRACCAATATHVLTVEGDDPADVHRQLAAALDEAHDTIREIQRAAREDGDLERRPWPMILLVTPKGWTGPAVVDGVQVEGTWRAHQVPLAAHPRRTTTHRAPARGVDAVLPARGALRRRRPAGRGAAGAGARRARAG